MILSKCLCAFFLAGCSIFVAASDSLEFQGVAVTDGREAVLNISTPLPGYYRIERSSELENWETLTTFDAAEESQHVDAGAPYRERAFYRATALAETNILTGDHLATTEGDVVIHPINHASVVLGWNGLIIYNDPVGGAAPYAGLPDPALILVSHEHGDHYDAATLNALRTPSTVIVAPQAVYNNMPAALKELTIVLANGAGTNLLGLRVDAVPAYNGNHPEGRGNGYVLTLGGKRIYFSGDTADVAEMRALENIDVAFLCMNVPFTMSVNQAASAVREFQPRVVYPYHYRNQGGTFANLESFKAQVGLDVGVEVRLRDWY